MKRKAKAFRAPSEEASSWACAEPVSTGTPHTVWVLLAATGYEDRSQWIQRHCRVGSPVALRREREHPHDGEAIAAWLRCPALFGLLPRWRRIGYVKANHKDRWAARLDDGSLQVDRAVVCSCYAPKDCEVPRISLQIEFRHV
ncbi:MAG TPA: hypothetical protein VJ832_13740 [Variovorax sp.]|nr:hypothetical protein [Variovorax sp.]